MGSQGSGRDSGDLRTDHSTGGDRVPAGHPVSSLGKDFSTGLEFASDPLSPYRQ